MSKIIWDCLVDFSQELGLVEAWVEDNYLYANGAVYGHFLECDPDVHYLLTCPQFRVLVSLHGVKNIANGGFYIREFGEEPLKIPITRITYL